MHVRREKAHHDLSSSVPPVLDTHRDWSPGTLEWQRNLPEVDEDGHKPARPPEDADDGANADKSEQ